MKLTHPLLVNAKAQDKPYKIRDRDSMYLRISVAGSKTWKFDYRLDGKACSQTLGHFPALSLMTRESCERKQLSLWLLASSLRLMRDSRSRPSRITIDCKA